MSEIHAFILSDLKRPIDRSAESIAADILTRLHLPAETRWEILRRSLDARDKHALQFVWQLQFFPQQAVAAKRFKAAKLDPSPALPIPTVPELGPARLQHRPVIVGSGPAGLFCAYRLAEYGLKPIVIERGRDVERRTADVEAFWAGGPLDPVSNVQFGEGGAGTFSDGKLTSRSKNPRGRQVLELFHQYGAKDDILWKQKPHIGTDILREVVKDMRQAIEARGGEFRFECQMTDLLDQDGASYDITNPGKKLAAIRSNQGDIPCEILVLALGHSARDSYRMLIRNGLKIAAKPFAVGLRIEHPQAQIDLAQYGADALERFGPCDVDDVLVPAEYQLTWQARQTGRGVYTFCMCPGGLVVQSASDYGQQVVNGMSYQRRDQVNANSALLCTVGPADFGTEAEDALRFQEMLEQRAWLLGQGLDPESDTLPAGHQDMPAIAPVQLLGDYLAGRASQTLGDVLPSIKPSYRLTDLNRIFPPVMNESLHEALANLGKKLADFNRPDAVLTAVESRTSSPLRILRDKELMTSLSSDSIYPIGEGAGYAGGIVSSAVDGLEAAEAILRRFAALEI